MAANGIAVPDRVQVIGFDNNEEAAYFQPPLTTMDSCLNWIAAAVSRIINRIDGSRTLEPELITTQSRVIAAPPPVPSVACLVFAPPSAPAFPHAFLP